MKKRSMDICERCGLLLMLSIMNGKMKCYRCAYDAPFDQRVEEEEYVKREIPKSCKFILEHMVTGEANG